MPREMPWRKRLVLASAGGQRPQCAMPFFRDDELRRLTGFRDSAEYELDLRGLDLAHAQASIERMLERSRFRAPRTVVIRIEKPSATSGETLFRPLGRQLVAAMKGGLVRRCRPLPQGDAGFWVELAGNPNAAADGEQDGGGPA
jgi:hypothetical protein